MNLSVQISDLSLEALSREELRQLSMACLDRLAATSTDRQVRSVYASLSSAVETEPALASS